VNSLIKSGKERRADVQMCQYCQRAAAGSNM
jgi:hypothetical protein